jgi:hypothetical protein
MNEQIRKLVRESNLDVYGLGKERYKWEYTIENFTKLIIDECIQVAHAAERKPEGFLYAKGAHILETEIYNHFGVKE